MPDGTLSGAVAPHLPPFTAANTLNTKFIPSVLIVGAGIGGITLALDLDEAGLTNWVVSPHASYPAAAPSIRVTPAGWA